MKRVVSKRSPEVGEVMVVEWCYRWRRDGTSKKKRKRQNCELESRGRSIELFLIDTHTHTARVIPHLTWHLHQKNFLLRLRPDQT